MVNMERTKGPPWGPAYKLSPALKPVPPPPNPFPEFGLVSQSSGGQRWLGEGRENMKRYSTWFPILIGGLGPPA